MKKIPTGNNRGRRSFGGNRAQRLPLGGHGFQRTEDSIDLES